MIHKLRYTKRDTCYACGKRHQDIESLLIPCAKCGQAIYCSPLCQQNNARIHGYECRIFVEYQGFIVNQAETGVDVYELSELERMQAELDTALYEEEREQLEMEAALEWLRRLPKDEFYNAIIDIYRLRLDDEYRFQGKKRGLYAGGRDNKPNDDFRDFLRRADSVNLFPQWWNPEKQDLCERRAEGCSWHQLLLHVNADLIKAQYQDDTMVQKLRRLGNVVDGSMDKVLDTPNTWPPANASLIDHVYLSCVLKTQDTAGKG
ncbi:hypothetical protein BDV97DRAFT_358995 [Delphinella strobiligena]|nr:hypothetical protein BDV97DRAFT_358995 [Delphinella strobiligena]